MTENTLKYKRVLLKLSGEAFAGDQPMGIDHNVVNSIADQLKAIHELGGQLSIVVGGGNLFRGQAASKSGMDRATADYIGMMATVMNAIALQDALEQKGLNTRVLSAITMQEVAEPYIRRRAIRHLEKNRIVIFAAGTGNPYFSTDTAAALRALETNCEVIIKATKVDGVYDKDPVKHNDAVMFKDLKYIEVLQRELAVMDATAISLCKDNNLPIIVFNLLKEGNILKVFKGDDIGTVVS